MGLDADLINVTLMGGWWKQGSVKKSPIIVEAQDERESGGTGGGDLIGRDRA